MSSAERGGYLSGLESDGRRGEAEAALETQLGWDQEAELAELAKMSSSQQVPWTPM